MKSYKLLFSGLLCFLFLVCISSKAFATLSYVEIVPNDFTVRTSVTTEVRFDSWAVSLESASTPIDSMSASWISTKPSGVSIINQGFVGPEDYWFTITNLAVDNTNPYLLRLVATKESETAIGYLRFWVTDQAITISSVEVQPYKVGAKHGDVITFEAHPYDQFGSPIKNYGANTLCSWEISSDAGTVSKYSTGGSTYEAAGVFTATSNTGISGNYNIRCTFTSFEGTTISTTGAATISIQAGYTPTFTKVVILPESSTVTLNQIKRFTSFMTDNNGLVYYPEQAVYYPMVSRKWSVTPVTLANITPLGNSWMSNYVRTFPKDRYVTPLICIDRALATVTNVSTSGSVESRMTDLAGTTTKTGSATLTVQSTPSGDIVGIVPSVAAVFLTSTSVATVTAHTVDSTGASGYANWTVTASGAGLGTVDASTFFTDLRMTFSPGAGRTAGTYNVLITATSGESSASFTLPVIVSNVAVANAEIIPTPVNVGRSTTSSFAVLPYDENGNYIDTQVYSDKLYITWQISSEAGTLEALTYPYQKRLYVKNDAKLYDTNGPYILYATVSFEGQTLPAFTATAEVRVWQVATDFSDVRVTANKSSVAKSGTVILKAIKLDNIGLPMSGTIDYTGITWEASPSYAGKIYSFYIKSLNDAGITTGVFNAGTTPTTTYVYASITSGLITHKSSSPAGFTIAGGGGGDVTVTNKLALTFPTVMTPSTPYALPSAIGTVYRAGDIISGTIIQYELSQNAQVSLYVYDLSGNLITKNEYASGSNGGAAGQNYINWNGKDMMGNPVPNGVYLTKIISGGKVIGSGKVTSFE